MEIKSKNFSNMKVKSKICVILVKNTFELGFGPNIEKKWNFVVLLPGAKTLVSEDNRSVRIFWL